MDSSSPPSESAEHSRGNVDEKQKHEPLVCTIRQSLVVYTGSARVLSPPVAVKTHRHEVQNDGKEEESDEFGDLVDNVPRQHICRWPDHGVLTLTNNDGPLSVSVGDFGHTRERIVQNGKEKHSTAGKETTGVFGHL